MAIAASDIIAYAAANKPEDDSSTGGGAIDADIRVEFTDIAANDDIEILSSAAGDTTQQATLVGRKADGTVGQETVTLNGTTAVIFSTLGVIERVLKVTLNADAAGVVTVRRSVAGLTVATIPIGERGFRRLFINAVSDPSNPKDYYEKIFLKNAHATLALLNAAVSESADPTTKVTFCLANAVDDSATNTNRLTAPSNANLLDPDTFNSSSQNVPGTNLAAGSAIGVWVKLSLAAAEAPIKSSWTPQLAGSST